MTDAGSLHLLSHGPSTQPDAGALSSRAAGCIRSDARATVGDLPCLPALESGADRRAVGSANEARVKHAVGTIDAAGSPEALIRKLAQREFKVRPDKKRPEALIALEIAVNDEAERELLELELAELEARWREEEELAAIVDGELTEVPLLERLRLRLPG